MIGRRTLKKKTTADIQIRAQKDNAQPPCVDIEERVELPGGASGEMNLDNEKAGTKKAEEY